MRNFIQISLILFSGFFLSNEKTANAQSQTFNYTGSIQTWTVPCGVDSITITASGAQGGDNYGLIGQNLGGKGASMKGTFTVTPGTSLNIIVAQRGYDATSGNTANGAGGGGGGSFIWISPATLLMAAGGGGGSSLTNNGAPYYYGMDAVTGTAGTGSRSGVIYNDALGGTNGNNGTYTTGAGKGWLAIQSNPAGITSCAYGGTGGYGGGGGSGCASCCSNPMHSAGGGGGYSGGGAGGTTYYYGGGGGGSYNIGTNQTNNAGVQSGNGTVIITWTPPSALTSTGNVINNVLCNGNSDGKASAKVSGGGTPYTYSWAPSGGSKDTATGLSATTYTVTVKDACANTVTAKVTITQPTVLSASASVTGNVLCNGGNEGSANIAASGGTPGYTYLWSDGETTTGASNLSAGIYTIKITDKNGCSLKDSAMITQPTALAVNASAVNPALCKGGCTNISAVTSGGTPSYMYKWSNGATTSTANVCPAVTTVYTITVTDANGCTYDSTVKVIVNALPQVSLSAVKDSACVNWTKDSLIGMPSGGTYSGTGVTGKNFNPSVAGIGSHSVIYSYTDSAGCSNADTIKLIVNACTGIQEVNGLDNEVTFYPNPFTQSINVNINMNEPVTITMFNMLGENVGTWQMEQGQHSISTQSLPAGVYTMQVKTSNGIMNKKLIKVN